VRIPIKSIVLPLSLFAMLGPAFGQIVVNNGPRPKNPNAWRTIFWAEVLRIREDGDKVVFKNPRQFARGVDESLFFIDAENLYRFGKDDRKL
jgi:hypothetical protein